MNQGINTIIFKQNLIFTSLDFLFFNSSNTQITAYISNGNLSDLIWNVTENLLKTIDLVQNYKFNIKLYFEFYSTQQTFVFSYVYNNYGTFRVTIKTELQDPTKKLISLNQNTQVQVKQSNKFIKNKFKLCNKLFCFFFIKIDVILKLNCPNYTVIIGNLETCNITVMREVENICVVLQTHEMDSIVWPYPPNFNVSICFNCKLLIYSVKIMLLSWRREVTGDQRDVT